MSYLDRIAACNNADMAAFSPLTAAGRTIGHVHRERLATLREAAGPEARPDGEGLTLLEGHADRASRSAAMAEVVRRLVELGAIPGERDEPFVVPPPELGRELLRVDRAVIPWLGIPSTGVHLNGIVRKDGDVLMWIGTRSAHLFSFPSQLDNLVAGGQPADITIRANLEKEASEEAGIPGEIAAKARSAGFVSCRRQEGLDLRASLVHCFDLELDADFRPVSEDGEVASFELLPIAEVAAIVREADRFKFNCNLVIIDFLVRHGYIEPDDPDFYAIVDGLRPRLDG